MIYNQQITSALGIFCHRLAKVHFLSHKTLLLAIAAVGLNVLPAYAADGLTASGNSLPIGTIGGTVLTITGGGISGDATFSGTVESDGLLSAPSGINVNNSIILNSNGIGFFSGSVGIGTTAPAYPLDVTGIISSTAHRVSQGGPSSTDGSTNGYAFGLDGDTGLFSPLRTDGPTNHGYDNGELGLFVNNLEAMHIKYTGNVGIGTASPIGNLDIENGSGTATICLNGVCAQSLGAPTGATIYSATQGGQTETPAGVSYNFCALSFTFVHDNSGKVNAGCKVIPQGSGRWVISSNACYLWQSSYHDCNGFSYCEMTCYNL